MAGSGEAIFAVLIDRARSYRVQRRTLAGQCLLSRQQACASPVAAAAAAAADGADPVLCCFAALLLLFVLLFGFTDYLARYSVVEYFIPC